MKTAKISSFTLVVVVAGWMGVAPAQACDTSHRGLPPSAAVAQNAAAMAKIGIYRMPRKETPEAQAHDVTPATIVGLWHSVYTYSGQVVDEGFETYHDDGTEMNVDLGPPAIGNVCNGAWIQTGSLTYKLTHMAWNFDDNGNVIGTIVIRDVVTLSPAGTTFRGTETLDLLDMNGKVYSHSEGTVKATRIAAN